ncbi:hypothetical protein ACFYNZ_05625 [Streptomyces kebangsaanensis]|uniref:Uncharacterized protein n=1 Tax=Streptomyces kebangsaanensis TaxID=864058 RepID=A0ABW6KM69_9ACTN
MPHRLPAHPRPPDEPTGDDLGVEYDFRFLTEEEAEAGNDSGQAHWYRVQDVRIFAPPRTSSARCGARVSRTTTSPAPC